MTHDGQMVAGYPIELFRLREPLGSSSELGNGM